MSTPYNPYGSGQNPNDPNQPNANNPYGAGNTNAHPEGVSNYGDYSGHEQLQPDYTRGEAGYPGYGMGSGDYNAQPTSYGYQPVQQPQKSNGVAVAALVLGILSLLGLVLVFPGFIFGLVALILGIVGLNKAKSIAGPGSRKGMSIAGIVMGVIAMVLSGLMMYAGFSVFNQMVEDGVLDACQQYENDASAYETCIQEEVEKSFDL